MKLVLSIAAGIILAIVLLAVGCSPLVASSVADDANVAAASDAVADTAPDAPDAPEVASGGEGTSETAGQENARRSAESYLDSSAFSRSGLIDQLEYEGYITQDATYAVDAVSPSWNEQAAKAAESYLASSGFSRSGLIDQLEYEGYTTQQAVYGANQTGL
jgi:colicin import membrane protein